MAEPPQAEQTATTTHDTEQATTSSMSPVNDSFVEAVDDATKKSTDATSPVPSSVTEIVSDSTNKRRGTESPASSSVSEVVSEESKKRKAADEDQTTPAKKQKSFPPEMGEANEAGDRVKKNDGDSGSSAAVNGSSQETQKKQPQYGSIEELKEIANAKLVEKSAEIKDLKAKIEDIESDRDKWQLMVATANSDAKHAEDSKDARDKALWTKALDWKKKELQHQVSEAKHKFQQDLEKAKVGWQKKLDKGQEKVEDLKKMNANQKEDIQELKKQTKEYKPGNSKALKEKSKELEASQNLLEAQEGQIEALTQRLNSRIDDIERIQAERRDTERKAKDFHKEWEKQVKLNEDLKAEHAEAMQKQYNKWHVQANNSDETQNRLVSRQRGLFSLNHAHDRVCNERDELRNQLKLALAESERLEAFSGAAAAAAAVSPAPHVQESRLQESEAQVASP